MKEMMLGENAGLHIIWDVFEQLSDMAALAEQCVCVWYGVQVTGEI